MASASGRSVNTTLGRYASKKRHLTPKKWYLEGNMI